MRVDWTLDLGVIINLAGVVAIAVAAYYAIKGRMGLFEQRLDVSDDRLEQGLRLHADALDRHTERFAAIDAEILKIVADLSQLIGRSEIFFRERGGGAVRGDRS